MHAVNPDTRCPCGELATHQIWEANLAVCAPHAVEWLHSAEKLRCTKGQKDGAAGGADFNPGDAAGAEEVKAATADFVARIAKDRPSFFEILFETAALIRAALHDAWKRWNYGRRGGDR